MAKTLVRITTVPMAFKVLLAEQPKFMQDHGFNVVMVSADGKELEDVKRDEGCTHVIVHMTRKITPFEDLRSFFAMRKVLKKYRPDIVHTHTPKAGLIGMMAAKSVGVKIRIHTVAGLPLMIETGFKRRLLTLMEKLTYRLATEVWPNSRSMKDFILGNHLTKSKKLRVINNGSSNGISLTKFSRQNLDPAMLQAVRATVPDSTALKILCVGRMVKDKGIEELVRVFEKLQQHYSLQLILIGPFEPDLDPLQPATLASIQNNPAIIHINWSDAIEYYMSLADIFVHPSHREGFPNVILQAGAMQLPVVCSIIPGNADIVQHEKTGWMFEVKNEDDLYDKLRSAIIHKDMSADIAHALFEEVTTLYSRKKMQEAILRTYNQLLEENENK